MSNREVLIHAENISKKFCRDLKQSLWYGMKDLSAEITGRSHHRSRLRKDEFWALEDVSFKVKRSEVLGIVGRNGAGKTTILRLINGLIKPDRGRLTVRGRVGALIALGAGFNPVLTGRENIYINAAVYGMSTTETDKNFDEIVAFAELEDFIDAPVQSYSSGMMVRLGFSVAVQIKPDILLVDEVLAVGDTFFRQKCLDRIREIKSEGTAIVFVSHEMGTVEGFCDTGICLDKARVVSEGSITSVVSHYQNINLDPSLLKEKDPVFRKLLEKERIVAESYHSKAIDIVDVQMLDDAGNLNDVFHTAKGMTIRIKTMPKRKVEDCILSISARRSDGLRCFLERSRFHGFEFPILEEGKPIEIEAKISPLKLTAGTYVLHIGFDNRSLAQPHGRRGGMDIFRVIDEMPNPNYSEGIFHPSMEWKLISS